VRVGRRVRVGLLATCVVLLGAGIAAVVAFDFGDDDGPRDSARRRAAAVTEADNGGEVTVAPTEPFIIDLAGSAEAPWGLPMANTAALARVSTSQDPDGSAAATFRPLEIVPGATITAERVPACRTAETPCETPTERFVVTIRVAPG